MKITKAVFPVAGLGTRFLPATKATPKEMMPIVDKPLIQYAVEEALAAGISELIFVTNSSKRAIEDHFDSNFELEATLIERGKLELLEMVRNILPAHVSCTYIRQKSPQGLGHAVLCAKHLIANEPFAVLLADDLIDGQNEPCLAQMTKAFAKLQSSIIAVEAISQNDTQKYGVIETEHKNTNQNTNQNTNINQNINIKETKNNIMRLKGIVEKPAPEQAPSNLGVVGRYILTPRIFDILQDTSKGSGGEIQLTDAIATLLKEEAVYALRFSGKRYDCGNKLSYIEATLAYALKHPELSDTFIDTLQNFIKCHL